MKKIKFFTVFPSLLALVFSSNLYAATYDFSFSQHSSNGNVDITDQLYVSVDDSDLTGALFTFYNDVGIESSITQVVFGDSGNIFSIIEQDGSSDGVVFETDPNFNGNDYGFVKTYSESSTNGVNTGVDSDTDWISFFGTFKTGETFEELLAAMESDIFNIGIHVQSINGEGSEKYVLNGEPIPGGFGNPVPLPAAVWLFGPALLGLIGFRKKLNS